MHLVYIGSEEEQRFLVDFLDGKAIEDTWIGLTSVAWLDGSRLTYDNLSPASLAFDQGGVCFAIVPPSSSRWLDDTCSATKHYICEKKGGEFEESLIELAS